MYHQTLKPGDTVAGLGTQFALAAFGLFVFGGGLGLTLYDRHLYGDDNKVVLAAADTATQSSTMPETPTVSTDAGRTLYQNKGCFACHSLDGTRLVGPSFQGLFGRKEIVVADGEEREILVDEIYLKRSITQPDVEVVQGFIKGQMPPIPLAEHEVAALVEFIQSLAQ